eukprot:13232-Heterococcus_DN1.PRE.2
MMQQTAAEALLDALQRLPAAYATALQQGDDSACTVMCQAAVAFAEAETPLVAGVGASQAGLALVEFILALTASGVKKVALLTMDFWIQLQETPVAERHPSLAHAVYTRLLGVLLQQCEYPQDFTGWEEHDVSEYDEDAFEDLRNGPLGVKVSSHMLVQVLLHAACSTALLAELINIGPVKPLPDVLVVIYYLLRAQFVEHVMQTLRERPASWQAVEACLLVMTHVAKECSVQHYLLIVAAAYMWHLYIRQLTLLCSVHDVAVRVYVCEYITRSSHGLLANAEQSRRRGLLREVVVNGALSASPLVLAGAALITT